MRLRLLLAHYVLILAFLNLALASLRVNRTNRILLKRFHYCSRLLRMADHLSLYWCFWNVIESLLSRVLHVVSNGFRAGKLVTRLLLLNLLSCADLQVLLLLPGLDGLSVRGLLSRNDSSHFDLHLLKIVDKFVFALILDLAHLLPYLLLQRSIPLRLVSFEFTVDKDEGGLILHYR